MNPLCQVPTLLIDGHTLTQSVSGVPCALTYEQTPTTLPHPFPFPPLSSPLPSPLPSPPHPLPYTQLAIIEYLDDTRGPPYLVPRDDALKRAQVGGLEHHYIPPKGGVRPS